MGRLNAFLPIFIYVERFKCAENFGYGKSSVGNSRLVATAQ